jgi:phospholipid/cholesterol/gamma-HCH transport system substrate-binding protein
VLTRFVRIQLAIFTIASIIGILAMVFYYLQAPTLLGIGRYTVTLEMPAAGGLYRFSNVTYRGVQIGRVTSVALTSGGAKAIMSLNTSPKIPADLQAQVRSVSAVGEQYVDLRPRTDKPPYLHDGSVIAKSDTTIPQDVGPLLDQTSALINSIPKDRLGDLLDESFQGFNGSGYDLGSLFDSSARVSGDVNGVADRTNTLVEDTQPLLNSQEDTTDSIRTWAHSLANVTHQFATNDAQVRTLLQKGPGFAQETTRLLDQIKPTLPVLLANLTTIGQIAVTYHASLEQLLVMLPPFVSNIQQEAPWNNPTGLPTGDFRVSVADPIACTVGFLPPSQWRSPADTTEVDTPDNLYCKLPQDSPIAVRGARNLPCMGHPGKRAPTVDICDSDQPYMPLAQREHAIGPYPFDPNLAAQGYRQDDRANPPNWNVYLDPQNYHPWPMPPPPGGAPPQGPRPQGPAPAPDQSLSPGAVPPQYGAETSGSLPPQGAPQAPAAPEQVPPAPANPPAQAPAPPNPAPATTDNPPPPASNGPQAAPSSFSTNGSGPTPSVAIVHYDPRTGQYMAPDGHMYRQSDLAAAGPAKTWQELVLRQG